MIINATLTPDYKTPSVASYVQAQLGLKMLGLLILMLLAPDLHMDLI